MSKLLEAANRLYPEAPDERSDSQKMSDEYRFIETLTFADADEILVMLHDDFEKGYRFPVWVRNLAYRLACLQRPDDPDLLREAAADLLLFGPDWDDIAQAMTAKADRIDPEGKTKKTPSTVETLVPPSTEHRPVPETKTE
ncbi:hypothetical protein LX15_003678 [Streptoalloteichus tenebrarius]|uniref:Uncharacterized protein n=1 Tax=Streptoalloteichus tenebrarius (strain ATCC 17920 / DSM 40477 / JCM 4838 / CBS 697.72 / NBRC 16177 / NCIMB 11028 / NRRL B-12390 / A12253. 1 / ISP 5477) TaxID=1933 RepID=A0ABT1HWQ7_STRSD|nr:hypothetical protein [Streptoalloteichus tenebrarius]MCP2259967.1 hypothetical protein [Streptoalloteichus tenebrarius]BFF03924.1 hypothetical protein GCM10020241_55990 [Streptoalloteichus tenebrarius]